MLEERCRGPQALLGKTVVVSDSKGDLGIGTVRFIGSVPIMGEGLWAGVEMATDDFFVPELPDNSKYFDCRPGHAMYCRPWFCVPLEDSPAAPVPPSVPSPPPPPPPSVDVQPASPQPSAPVLSVDASSEHLPPSLPSYDTAMASLSPFSPPGSSVGSSPSPSSFAMQRYRHMSMGSVSMEDAMRIIAERERRESQAELQAALQLLEETGETAEEKVRQEHAVRLQERAMVWGLTINKNTDDSGDCQFDAIADQLCQRWAYDPQQTNKETVRERVVGWLRKHKDHVMPSGQKLCEAFKLFETDFDSLDEYCDHMEKPRVWGDVWTLMAAAEEFQAQITIFSSTTSEAEGSQQLHFGPAGTEPGFALNMKQLFLGHILELHYVSLLDDTTSASMGSLERPPY